MKKLVLTVAIATLAACQTGAPLYQAANDPSQAGYFVAPADNGRISVTYTGTKKMTSEQVAELALLRAAEVTTAAGSEWFAVLDTATRQITLNEVNNLEGRSGSVLSSGSTSARAAGGDRTGASPGVGDGSVPSGPSTGGFGGGDVPYQVLERWTPPTVEQVTILIQPGSGSRAGVEGSAVAPQIYSATDVAARIRAKMKM